MNTRTLMQGAALLALALSVAGCASPVGRWDAQFGDSVRANVAAQVVNPAAVRNDNAVAGLDGRAAQAAQTNYESSFQRPVKTEAAITTSSGR